MGGVWSGALAGGYSIAGGLGDGSPTAGSRGGALIGGLGVPQKLKRVYVSATNWRPHYRKKVNGLMNF